MGDQFGFSLERYETTRAPGCPAEPKFWTITFKFGRMENLDGFMDCHGGAWGFNAACTNMPDVKCRISAYGTDIAGTTLRMNFDYPDYSWSGTDGEVTLTGIPDGSWLDIYCYDEDADGWTGENDGIAHFGSSQWYVETTSAYCSDFEEEDCLNLGGVRAEGNGGDGTSAKGELRMGVLSAFSYSM